MVAKQTVVAAVEQLTRWQRKHGLRDDQMDELLRWLRKVSGNKSYCETVHAIGLAYKAARD